MNLEEDVRDRVLIGYLKVIIGFSQVLIVLSQFLIGFLSEVLIGCLAHLEEDVRVEPRKAQHSEGRLYRGLSRLIFNRTLEG